MAYFVYTVKWHIGNVFNKPPRQNAPTDRGLTSVILKGIEWAFRKVYPTKIPGMVHQGLLAPQSLLYIKRHDVGPFSKIHPFATEVVRGCLSQVCKTPMLYHFKAEVLSFMAM